jgi:uncharacterized protein YndB with AHSA1/START domain
MTTVTSSRSAVLTLPTDTQIKVTREFNAGKHLVFKAYTTPELVRMWWHAKRGTMTVCEIDLRVGGTWRYVMETPEGMEVAFHGEYKEIVPDEKLVTTEVFEGVPVQEGAEVPATINTLTLTESNGRTTATILIDAPDKFVRDAIISSGMENGLQDALDLLEEAAASLA